jgi:hypothetical protein
MRSITARHVDRGFDETVRELVRGSPWWLVSLVVHAVVLAVLWSIPIATEQASAPPVLQAGASADPPAPEEIPQPEPEPTEPEDDIVEDLVLEPEDDDINSDDADVPTPDTLGDDGSGEGPLTGPSDGRIGLGPSGGGPRGTGGPRHGRVKSRTTPVGRNLDLALEWLARHQDVDGDGRWDCDDFMRHDPADDRCDGAGGALHDVGVTGLALLAFLGADYTGRGNGPYAKNVRRGLQFLLSSQEADGCLGSRASHSFMYSHAIGTLALCEAYWMTRNPRYRKPAQDAVNFLSMARNPYMAWRYMPRGGANDTSVTGWCVMALKSAKYAGLEVDPDAFEGARQWIDKMTDPQFGQVGYDFPGGPPARPEGRQDRFPAEKSRSMTAVGVLTRIFLGEDPDTSELIRKGADLCVERLPTWNPDDGSIDMYYWYYGTLALFQVGGPRWAKWNRAMVDAIVNHQHAARTGSRTGSWDPLCVWGDEGGRVYSTALLAMCLEVYYRYPKVFGTTDVVRR